MEPLAIILSSTVISGVVSALVSGWFNVRSKQSEYANAYYKLILERRLRAYEEVETLINSIKVAVMDDDRVPYHLLFSNDENTDGVHAMLTGVMSRSLWLSDELFEITRELSVFVYQGAAHDAGLIEFGKANYRDIAELRTRMERVLLRDMLTLHDAPAFLASKKPDDSYVHIPEHRD
jgi:hypothetical protein